jgi:hypothetical protein
VGDFIGYIVYILYFFWDINIERMATSEENFVRRKNLRINLN